MKVKKTVEIICSMLTSLVSLQQGNVKKIEKSVKIVNIEKENLLNDLRNFSEIFRKNVAYDDIMI